MHRLSTTLLSTLCLTAFGLTACSSEPSEAEIQALFEQEVTNSQDSMDALSSQFDAADMPAGFKETMQDSMKFEIHSVTKQGCEKSGDAYLCDVTVDATIPFIGRNQNTNQVRLIETDSGWAISQ